MKNIVKILIGCCLIHLCIGSIYAISVLYPKAVELSGWDNSVLVTGFSLTILSLGISASLHQRWFKGWHIVSVLLWAAIMWALSSLNLVYNFSSREFNEVIHYLCSIWLGVAIGILYVVPINIMTAHKSNATTSGLVVFCFGLGSILAAAKLFKICELGNLMLVGVLVYTIILLLGIFLIHRGLPENNRITYSNSFKRNKIWYILAAVFFLNIGIGISLLSNLTQLSLDKGYLLDDAIVLVALAGLANTLGRFVYPILSDLRGSKLEILCYITDLQTLAIMLAIFNNSLWNLCVILILSVYGGVFALMPSLLKQLYKDSNAYSQILIMWGFAGLICPIIFNMLGIFALLFMSTLIILLLSYCILQYKFTVKLP